MRRAIRMGPRRARHASRRALGSGRRRPHPPPLPLRQLGRPPQGSMARGVQRDEPRRASARGRGLGKAAGPRQQPWQGVWEPPHLRHQGRVGPQGSHRRQQARSSRCLGLLPRLQGPTGPYKWAGPQAWIGLQHTELLGWLLRPLVEFLCNSRGRISPGNTAGGMEGSSAL